MYAQAAEADVYHLRTHGGRHEIDFIIENENGITGIEAKLSGSVNDQDVKHLHWLKEKTGHECLNLAIITTGNTAYRRSDGIAAIPLALVGP